MAGITAADIQAYIAHRQTQGVVRTKKVIADDGTITETPVRVADVSNAEVNRELTVLKRMFSLAIAQERLARKPAIPLLAEANARTGFFEPDQLTSVLAHLPSEIRPIVRFAAITGWRIASEVLPLEWRNVDFDAGEVRLDKYTTKNKDGRVFPMTSDLRSLLKAQHVERERVQKAGHLVPYVFFREVADGRGGEKKPRRITTFTKSWQRAVIAAGCPGRIPHDLRRTAVRHLVRAGVPQTVAMKLTGHKTDSVFRRYDITSAADLRVAVERLDAVAGR
jgi:integrase